MKIKIKVSLPFYQELVGKHTFLSGEPARVRRDFSPMPLVEGTLTPHWEGNDIYKSLYILLGSEDKDKRIQVSFNGLIKYVPIRTIKDITIVE